LPECYVFYPAIAAIWKNQLRVIEAIAILHRQHNLNIHAVFAGPMGQYGEQLRDIARHQDVEKLIHFLGPVPDSDMALLYRNALCLIMASYLGPTNMPIWEAFAIGCPVISSNAGAMPDQVMDAGLLFDPSDAPQLAECILQLYRDLALRKMLVQRGFERIAPLRPEIWAQNLLQAIRKAVA
jgi:glycosyltransferase involved in cell wall biosynthesis